MKWLKEKNLVEELSFEEVYERYQGLAISRIKGWLRQYEYDDLYQVAMLGLYDAYQRYDIEYNKVFSSYAVTNINFKLLAYNAQNNKFSREKSNVKELLSLDFEYEEFEEGLVNTIINFRVTEERDSEIFVEETLSTLDIREKDLVKKVCFEGHTITELAKEKAISLKTLSYRYRKALNKLKAVI